MTGQGVNFLRALTEKTSVDCCIIASWALHNLLNIENKTSDSLSLFSYL